MQKNILILIDHPTRNWMIKSLTRHAKLDYLLKKHESNKTITSHYVGKRASSPESHALGQPSKGKYLNDDMYTEVTKKLKTLEQHSYDTIVCMGVLSSWLLTDGLSGKECMSRTHIINGQKIFCMRHPDTFITDKHRAWQWKQDFEHVLKLLGITTHQKDLKNIDVSIEICESNNLMNYKEVGMDIETSGSTIDTISFCGDLNKVSHVVKNPFTNLIEKLMSEKIGIFHNGLHDIKFMKSNGYITELPLSEDWEDTMLAAQCLTPMNLQSLDEVEKSYVGKWPAWKSNLKRK